MLICIPTLPGQDEFEIEADSIADAVEQAEDYCEVDEFDEGVKIDYSKPAWIMEPTDNIDGSEA